MTERPPLYQKDWSELHKAAIRIHQANSLLSACQTASAFLFRRHMIRAFRASMGIGGPGPGSDLLVLPDDDEISEGDDLQLLDSEIDLPTRETLRIEVSLLPANAKRNEAIIGLLFQHLEVAARKVPVVTNSDGPATVALSPREAEVLPLVLAGRSNPEIASTLGISHRTVEKHVSSLLTKFNCENRFALIAREMRKNG